MEKLSLSPVYVLQTIYNNLLYQIVIVTKETENLICPFEGTFLEILALHCVERVCKQFGGNLYTAFFQRRGEFDERYARYLAQIHALQLPCNDEDLKTIEYPFDRSKEERDDGFSKAIQHLFDFIVQHKMYNEKFITALLHRDGSTSLTPDSYEFLNPSAKKTALTREPMPRRGSFGKRHHYFRRSIFPYRHHRLSIKSHISISTISKKRSPA